jgi:hypothetical protein
MFGLHPGPRNFNQAAHPTPDVQNRMSKNVCLGQASFHTLNQTSPQNRRHDVVAWAKQESHATI